MNCNTTKLRDAITFALAVGTVSSAGIGAAIAQEATETTTLDRIEVTGSRIRQVELENAQPVLTISREDIQAGGFNTVADILQNISSAGNPTFSRTSPLTANQEAGGQYIDLRNLGAQRTLVLLNGKRLGISPDGFQDVSTIPSVVVERIDVLKDGASSIYGSDAMAGVINIITRRNFEGAEANVYFGQYDEGDGQKQTYDFMIGMAGDRGSLTIGAEYHKEDGVWARDRWFTNDSYPGYPQYSTTVVGQWGNWRVGSTGPWQVADRGSDALGPGGWHNQTADDTSKPSDQMHTLTPLERRSLFVSANYDLTDKVRFVTDLGYTKRQSFRQIAGYPTQSQAAAIQAPMSAASYFNPTGGTDPVNWRRRGWEVPRTTDTNQTTWRFTAALEGSFNIGDRYFDWDAGYMYNENDLQIINNGNLYIPNIRLAVGPSFMNSQGQIVCGTQGQNGAPDSVIAGCVPWNPFAGFGTGAVANSLEDPAVQAFLYKQEHALGKTETNNYFANLTGSLWTLPAGDLAFAVGVEHRKEEGGFTPDAIAQSGNSTNLASGPTYGSYSLDEVYAELNIPILADLSFAKELSLSVATRYSDFDTFGDTTNNKFGLKWRPIDDLLVRATWSEGFRAPTIGDLYGGTTDTFTTGFRDPCDSVFGDAAGSPRCLQDVPADYRQLKQGFEVTDTPAAQTPVPFRSGSNPFLEPEFSKSKTVGFVYSPSFAQGLTVALDWWNIRINNTVVSDHPNDILSDCYVALIESRCGLFSRDPALGNIVTNLSYGGRNAGYTETEGYDLDLNYVLDTDYGRFNAKWSTTYVSLYELKSTNDADTVPEQSNGIADNNGVNFRIRSNLNLGWTLNDFGVTWGMRYNSGAKEECFFDEHCSHPNYQAPWTQGSVVPMNRVGSVTFHDLQVSWSAPWNARIAIGANNVFGKDPPIFFTSPASGFSFYGGHDLGRFLYARYQQKF
ncbi:TonB-dependent receptor domain-containing protein [Pseudoxanthomonas wuyuanensis]|uniref:Iron complex outermembrane recepter protein n=1 Tax=Pseudoxanthomonas wuyuanensis TaxID=1073196 RepID=A0A286D499_9GAMM|nr:TonB-dependent receptor [Pseudoxanthomonas wuyuanensis]KAF1717241.1 TonB-dependent receptor [Pseudoxanthomonas wuyuanensis]SOD53479.1 iron complex outermembrane recepter protein [Pseudoxanthomonas wuyuanensis]